MNDIDRTPDPLSDPGDDAGLAATEALLRRTLAARADSVEPAADALPALARRVDDARRTAARRRTSVLAIAASAAVVAGIAGGAALASRDGTERIDVGGTPSSVDGTTVDTAPGIEATGATEPPIIWPLASMSVAYPSPEDAASAFATGYLALPAPIECPVELASDPPTDDPGRTELHLCFPEQEDGEVPQTFVTVQDAGARGWVVTSAEAGGITSGIPGTGSVFAGSAPLSWGEDAPAGVELRPLGSLDPVLAIDPSTGIDRLEPPAPGTYVLLAADADGAPSAHVVTFDPTAVLARGELGTDPVTVAQEYLASVGIAAEGCELVLADGTAEGEEHAVVCDGTSVLVDSLDAEVAVLGVESDALDVRLAAPGPGQLVVQATSTGAGRADLLVATASLLGDGDSGAGSGTEAPLDADGRARAFLDADPGRYVVTSSDGASVVLGIVDVPGRFATDATPGTEIAGGTTLPSPTTTPSPTSTPSSPTTTPLGADDGTVGWDSLDEVFADPVTAARAFATEVLGFAQPTLTSQAGSAGDVEVGFTPRPTASVTTIIRVHDTGGPRGWVVTEARSDQGTIQSFSLAAADGEGSDISPVRITGTGTAFEATLTVRLLNLRGEVLASTSTMAGANGEIGPFDTEIDLPPSLLGSDFSVFVLVGESDASGEGDLTWATVSGIYTYDAP